MKKLVWFYIRKVLGRMDALMVYGIHRERVISSRIGREDRAIPTIDSSISSSYRRHGIQEIRTGKRQGDNHVGRMSFEKNIHLIGGHAPDRCNAGTCG